ncbi:hypothetical protein FisN_13Lh358 [Fistulifera solaris]|uniref:EamA domain-containing protein n=1 Tax=Fistulifera solaris TaxID=1519565 RepID=A0A1Z5KMD2_FISSO|nr:hypothetical protein FisN_13Lh358 [Fistulifera solaris]|eukprot:GAX27098.1 hypothetical protein FisN_13Lh358 [Fistulifera solaris]
MQQPQQEEYKDEETPLLLPTTTTSTTTTTTTSTTPITVHPQWHGRGWLLGVAFLYGTLNVTLRSIYAQPHPPSAAALSTSRGWLAVLCFLPLLLRQKTKPSSTIISFPALELAVWNFGAQGLANIGLLTVPSARAAFLTQTSVVWTPFLSCLVKKNHCPQRHHWWASFVCACGLGLLSWSHAPENAPSNSTSHHAYGHVLLLLAAGCWSMYIVRLSTLSVGHEEVSLQACKNVYLATLYSLWWLLQSILEEKTQFDASSSLSSSSSSSSSSWYLNPILWCLLLYSALGPGTLADIGQQHGQCLLQEATESNVWLSLEPVFTALLGYCLLNEPLSWVELGGGGLVVSAALWSSGG